MPNEDYDIGKAFKAIEDELIASMIRNLKRHRAKEEKEGKEWTQWQVEQLQALEKYKKENAAKYNKRFKNINAQIGEMIRAARDAGNTEQEIAILNAIKNGFKAMKKTKKELTGEFFKLNERKLDALIKATTEDMKKAETAILRMANDKYRKIIFNAQVYANTGAGTYEKAVDMATRDMLNAGLNCVQYANKARHTLSDYADMAIRTANKRAYLQGEGEKRQEWGISTVIMNKRGNACPKCLPFVGKVMIDDVWSGGKASDGPYPLLSSAIAKGLYHPRCKDSHTTYFPGISTADDSWTKEELAALGQEYEHEQKQQYAERQVERFERLAKHSLDKDNRKKYTARAEEWKQRAQENRNMANKSDDIVWPSKGIKISNDQYKTVMTYAREKGIEMSGFKHFDGDMQTLYDLIDDADSVAKLYPEIKTGKRKLTIMLDDTISSMDFAITRGHIVSINGNAYRNTQILAEEYDKLVEAGWFVKGTDYHSIIKHELGHVISNAYKIDGLEIAKRITGIDSMQELMLYLEDNLSSYSGYFEDGSEIISECFASVYGSNKKNDFALQFVEECSKIISKGG